MPSSLAATLTGGSWVRPPRPAARSGWLTARTTSNLAAARERSEGTANSGEPIKTMRVRPLMALLVPLVDVEEAIRAIEHDAQAHVLERIGVDVEVLRIADHGTRGDLVPDFLELAVEILADVDVVSRAGLADEFVGDGIGEVGEVEARGAHLRAVPAEVGVGVGALGPE